MSQKRRGPIGVPVRIAAGVTGLLVVGIGVLGLFMPEAGSALFGGIAITVGFLLLMLAFKAGPAPPGTRAIELARYRWARRAQWVCWGVGLVGLAVVRSLAPEAHTLNVLFTSVWIAGFLCSVFSAYYLAQAKTAEGSDDDAA